MIFEGVARGIRHFHVKEQVSYDGVANLYLEGREQMESDHARIAACR